MKEVRILALASMLALGLSLSAQTKGQMKHKAYKASETTSQSTVDSKSDRSLPGIDAPTDYNKNPYWAPQDYGYMQAQIIG